MSVEVQTQPGAEVAPKKRSAAMQSFMRVAKYTVLKVFMLFITVAVGVYLTILIANMGGYVDQIMKGEIRERIAQGLNRDPQFKAMLPEQRAEWVAQKVALEEDRLGLNRPFALRSISYLTNALQMELGRAQNMSADSGSRQVRLIILERLAPTLLLMGFSNMFLFFGSIGIALGLSRKYGSFWDKMIVAMSPTSSAPPWFYGVFFILIFAAVFRVLPFGGMLDAPPPTNQVDYALSVMKHLILPSSAIIISAMFISIYNWRTFFLIYSSEDYVDMAKAKGLSNRDVESRYILRPTLPTIITNFGLLVITLWTGAIITETVFSWPGLGRTAYRAIGLFDTPVIVGLTIIYAYLLALTVFLLDIIYAIVDPRVKIGG